MNKNFHQFTMNKINGQSINLESYKGKVLLVVNVASECGLTPQYESLEKIYEKYNKNNFEVLGFPANEFGAQEPGSNAAIHDFCTSKFGIKFPMFEKIIVKGEGQHALYQFLTNAQPEAKQVNGNAFEEKLKTYGITRTNKTDILWNFEKFLINKNGEVVQRFGPDVEPNDPIITTAIEQLLNS